MQRKSYLALYSLVYAIAYTFCLYKNLHGITFPLFVIATFFYGQIVFKELAVESRKSNYLYMGCALLISMSQITTANSFIHIYNVLFVFGLIFCFFMHQFSNDTNWSLPRYLYNIWLTFWGAFTNIFSPFRDYHIYKEEKASKNDADNSEKQNLPYKKILLTVIVTLPAVLIILTLLASADAVFKNLTLNLLKFNWPDIDFFGVIFLSAFIFLMSYGLITFLQKRPFDKVTSEREKEKADAVIASTVGIMFDLIYIVFSIIQIFYLFIGNFELPKNMTYAEYAREGFFQILFVCAFNLILVLLGNFLFRESNILKCILTILCGCTYIMIASSAMRMLLYIRYYYFTFYRILVLWALFTLAVLMTGVLINIWKRDFKLFRYLLVTCLSLYLILSFSHTEYFVAKWNLSQTKESSTFFLTESNYEDLHYVRDLSLDAAPAIYKYCDDAGTVTYFEKKARDEKITPRHFNFSVYTAQKMAR